MCTPAVPALGRWRKENQKFKVLLGYITRLKPAYTTQDFVSENINISIKWEGLHINMKARHPFVTCLKRACVWRILLSFFQGFISLLPSEGSYAKLMDRKAMDVCEAASVKADDNNRAISQERM